MYCRTCQRDLEDEAQASLHSQANHDLEPRVELSDQDFEQVLDRAEEARRGRHD